MLNMVIVQPSLSDQSLSGLTRNISNAFIGIVQDMYRSDEDVLTIFSKNNRYMYLSLVVLVFIFIANIISH